MPQIVFNFFVSFRTAVSIHDENVTICIWYNHMKPQPEFGLLIFLASCQKIAENKNKFDLLCRNCRPHFLSECFSIFRKVVHLYIWYIECRIETTFMILDPQTVNTNIRYSYGRVEKSKPGWASGVDIISVTVLSIWTFGMSIILNELSNSIILLIYYYIQWATKAA